MTEEIEAKPKTARVKKETSKVTTESTSVAKKVVVKTSKNPIIGKATGKRKSSIARVFIYSKKEFVATEGFDISVNKRSFIDVFGQRITYTKKIQQIFTTSGLNPAELSIKANIVGGGLTGFIDALVLGIARAIKDFGTKEQIEKLQSASFFTRDPRVVESKKPGLRKARKREQFSKR